ncbi:EF-hand protein [Venustampulla echinocandica]|uniref:EF-hand protein n=1 Tax=Venustampulla echinocandica TaxID=2656787 RepID=A0A370TB78_9HELO|nr:EF-hand protein [Venustampulla echinocandica]RDL31193.1 EF-hand protein [Venustampulla echinocandica]
MSASSTTASSTLSRSRAAVLLVASLAAACGAYYLYSSAAYKAEAAALPGGGLHRRNAIHRRRRRNTTTDDDPSSLFVDNDAEQNENEEGHLVARTLTDGDTVVDDQAFEEEFGFNNLPQAYQRNGQNIVQLLFRVSEDATRRNAYVHRGCGCNGCGAVPIRGIRYRCSNCADYDLCEGCESQGLHTKTHIFYKIRVPGPSFGPKNIQPVWYAGDPDSVMRVLPKEITTKLSRETGFERPELDAYWEQWTFMANTDWREDPDDIGLAMDRKTFERCLVPSGGYRHPSPSLIFDRMFAFYDTNKDDLIGFPEFLHGIGYRKKKNKWARIFEGYDIDGDGYVDRKDFLRMFRSYYVLYRQMHRDMLEGMEEQQMSSTEAHRLVNSRQPLSSAFGQDGRYPRAPDVRAGEGKTSRTNGDLEIIDGKGVMNESSSDTGNREDIFRQNIMTLSRYHQLLRDSDRHGGRNDNMNSGGYWETMVNPPQTQEQLTNVVRNMRRIREQAEDILQGRINANGHSLGERTGQDGNNDNEGSSSESDEGSVSVAGQQSWLPSYVTVTDEDAEAIEGPGTCVDDVSPESRQTVIAHAVYRERAQREIYDRWKRRQFYTDEEEGAAPPSGWKEDDDVLVDSAVTGESSKSQHRPSMHSRSSSKVRFAEDMDDFDTRSNPSTSSRSVPERWGGIEIPDAERDSGKEILYQVTQQAFNELLDPLFKEKEDLAVQAAELKDQRERYRALFTTPEFDAWANEKEAEETKGRETTHTQAVETRPVWPNFPETEVEEVRQRPLGELLESTGYQVEITDQQSDHMPELVAISDLLQGGALQDGVSNGNEDQYLCNHQPSEPADITTEHLPPRSHPPALHPEPLLSASPSYRDPTLPQFRPNSAPMAPVTTRAPHFSRFAEDLPGVDAEDHALFPIGTAEELSLTTNNHTEAQPQPEPHETSATSQEANHADGQPSQETLYLLWKCDNAAKLAEKCGGWGRLNLQEFEVLVKLFVKEGKGNQMDYLGSWIDLCIP